MRILFTGGGTAGSVMPLMAIYSTMHKLNSSHQFMFIGTRQGKPEENIVSQYDIQFKKVYSGKLRRYFDVRNFTDSFLLVVGFFQSLIIVYKFRPEVVVGAGGYVSVPVIWAAWILRKKILLHQQDIKPSLANKLCTYVADKITVTFERSLQNFPIVKTVWTGNPVRRNLMNGNRDRALEKFDLKKDVPLILVVGGGTGARGINTVVNQSLSHLVAFSQIVHITGEGKHVTGINHANYQQHEFIIEGMVDLLFTADLVISRAGLSSLTEFSMLGKAAILIPLPDSHQEINADYFLEKGAAIVIKEKDLTPGILVNKVRSILTDQHALEIVSNNMRSIMKRRAADTISSQIIKLATNGFK